MSFCFPLNTQHKAVTGQSQSCNALLCFSIESRKNKCHINRLKKAVITLAYITCFNTQKPWNFPCIYIFSTALCSNFVCFPNCINQLLWFQAPAVMLIKSVVFWVITRRRVVIIYRRFGTTYRSHLHGSRFQVGNTACWQRNWTA